jgi:hypothetical protein
MLCVSVPFLSYNVKCQSCLINRDLKKKRKKAVSRRYFLFLNFMTRFFGNSAALYIIRNRLYTSIIHTEQKIFPRSKDGTNIIQSLHREYFYFFFRSLFFPPRAPPASRAEEIKKKNGLDFSFFPRRRGAFDRFLTLIRFFQS